MILVTDENSDDLLKQLFGEVIFEYTDAQAIEDGILIPYVANGKDTRHRITSNAYESLKQHYAPQYPEYKETDFYRFFFCELLPLVPEAFRQWNHGEVLTTNYSFRVEKHDPQKNEQLWHLPNEVGGVTTMKPEDY